jgi:SAM-dependent methyltransferase
MGVAGARGADRAGGRIVLPMFASEVPEHGTPAWWEERYQSGEIPWDSGIVPPEVQALVASGVARQGWALDLGCGSGASSRYLARHGFKVIGIDLALSPLQRARRAAHQESLPAYFCLADVADLGWLPIAAKLALDVGCLHALPSERRQSYAHSLAQRLLPGASYLVYAHDAGREDGEEGTSALPGLAFQDIALFVPQFRLCWAQHGYERGRSSTWYLLERTEMRPR